MTEHRAGKPANLYAEAYAGFLEQTKDHELKILHDDGIYRHFRIQAPGTRMWSWDITTWPGHLATSGDIADGYMFSRTHDMIEFFTRGSHHQDHYSDGAPSIDVRYWAEKLSGGRSHDVKEYYEGLFLRHVREALEENEDLGVDAQKFYEQQLVTLTKLDELRGDDETRLAELLKAHHMALDHADLIHVSRRGQDMVAATAAALWGRAALSDDDVELLVTDFDWFEVGDTWVPRLSPAERRAEIYAEAERVESGTQGAHEWLRDNELHVGGDTWEWHLREYDTHFLFTVYCIELGVRLYNEHVAALASPLTNASSEAVPAGPSA